MSEKQRDFAVGRGKPPVHTRFKKGQSGNPRGPLPKNLAAAVVKAPNDQLRATRRGSPNGAG
jgi:hypothetical protein